MARNSSGAHESAAPSDSFVDSFGVNTHFNYRGRPYQTAEAQELASLRALGIRHIRDGLPNPSAHALEVYRSLCDAGIHHSIQFNVDTSAATMTSTIDRYDPACIDAVEPQNEYDGSRDPNWAGALTAEQKLLYATVKGNRSFARITVLGPALSSISRYAQLGDLDAYSDAGNMHDATCDGNPGGHYYRTLDSRMDFVRSGFPTKPIWATETAYSDALLGSGLPQAHHCGVPDAVIAKYVPRTQAERWSRGQPRIYWYEFSDEPSDRVFGAQGFVDADGQPKPQYIALQSLLRELSDRGPAFAPQPVALSLDGDVKNVRHLLLARRDGSYQLLVWQEVPSWDVVGHAERSATAQSIRVSLPTTVKTIRLSTYLPSWRFTERTVNRASSGFDIPVTDTMEVVEFKP